MAKPRIRDAKASNLFDKDICAIPHDTEDFMGGSNMCLLQNH